MGVGPSRPFQAASACFFRSLRHLCVSLSLPFSLYLPPSPSVCLSVSVSVSLRRLRPEPQKPRATSSSFGVYAWLTLRAQLQNGLAPQSGLTFRVPGRQRERERDRERHRETQRDTETGRGRERGCRVNGKCVTRTKSSLKITGKG